MSFIFLFTKDRSGGAVGLSVRPASGRLGIRTRTATDLRLVVKTKSDSSTVKRSAIDVGSRVLGDDHYKRMPRVTVGVAR